MNLNQLGWNSRLAAQFEAMGLSQCIAARVVRAHGRLNVVMCEQGELTCEMTGRLRHEAEGTGDLPALGDWVAIEARPNENAGTIQARLPRFSKFSRKAAGERTDEQVIAANINTALLMTGLDNNFNLRRIERYLTLTWNSGADAVIVLNKADMCDDVDAYVAEVEQIARGAPVHAISAASGEGVPALDEYLFEGRTIVALGSSGVGKSTLVNALLGSERQVTNEVREHDSHGRHTTTYGELIPLPGGAIYVDTPGLREVQLWGDEDDLRDAFDDVSALAAECKFNDCTHRNEPGCAVRQAIRDGQLDSKRLVNFQRMQKELAHLSERQRGQAMREKNARNKQIAIWYRQYQKQAKKREME